MICCAWAIYLLAWFLPVHKLGDIFGGLPGWVALRVALLPVWPCDGTEVDPRDWGFLWVASGATNLVMFGSVWAVDRGSRRTLLVMGWAAAAAVIINAQWIFSVFHQGIGGTDLRIGYYLWWLSFLPLAVGIFVLVKQESGGRIGEPE